MVYRKGEITSDQIDRNWPHQVATPERLCIGGTFPLVQAFCRDLSLAPRGHAVVFEGERYQVRCFADRAHAAAFMARFGGEWFDPRERGRGRRWMVWNKGTQGKRGKGEGTPV